jgi:2-hydroxychromene-2-carboxylate isomerase
MGAPLDFWYDFASTYSYPAAARIRDLAKASGIKVRFRPFLLGPIFKAQGWETSPFNLYDAKGRHMWRDLERLCAELHLPFRRPEPFPQNSLRAARLTLVGLPQGWGEDFTVAVYFAEFAQGRQINDSDTLGDILATLNVDKDVAFAAAQGDPIKTALRVQTEEAQRLGIFGAPSFVTDDGELFWGNDRLDQAIRRAKRT